jgi:hypothetical protein
MGKGKCIFTLASVAILLIGAKSFGQEQKKRDLLRVLDLATKTYRIRSAGAFPQKVEDVAVYIEDKDFIAKLKNEFVIVGIDPNTLSDDERSKKIMLYEKGGPKKGGLVMYCDGHTGKLNSDEISKLIKKE